MSSADYGIRKQHPLLYEVALKNFQTEPADAIYFGDNLEYDIKTAQNAGLVAAWYNKKSIENETQIIPDLAFTDWSSITLAELRRVMD